MNSLAISIVHKLCFLNMGLDIALNSQDIFNEFIRHVNPVQAVLFQYEPKHFIEFPGHFNEIRRHVNRAQAVPFSIWEKPVPMKLDLSIKEGVPLCPFNMGINIVIRDYKYFKSRLDRATCSLLCAVSTWV